MSLFLDPKRSVNILSMYTWLWVLGVQPVPDIQALMMDFLNAKQMASSGFPY